MQAALESMGTLGQRTLVLGGSGVGKSMALALFCQRCRQNQRVAVASFFCGATPGSTDPLSVVLGICEQLALACEHREQLPSDFEALCGLIGRLVTCS